MPDNHTYTYDALDRMSGSSEVANYDLDIAGNRGETSDGDYKFSGTGQRLHQYSGSPLGNLWYDAAGRLNTLATTPQNAYVYDALGRLKELYLGTGAALLDFENDELPSPHEVDAGTWVAHFGYMEETSSGRGRIRWLMDPDMRRFAFRYWSGTDPENAANYDPEYYAQVIVRASENSTTQEWTFVALEIQPDGIYLRQWINDAVTELGGVAVQIPKEKWHDITIELSGGHVSVRQVLFNSDDVQSIEANTDIAGAAGQSVGFGVGEKANFKFDDVGTDKPVTQGLKLHYDYDTYGNVVGRTLYDSGGTVESQQFFIYDNGRIVQELDGTGAIVAEWAYGTYIDEPLAMFRGGQTYYYLHDDLYNVIALTDDQGNAVERYTYDDYGAPTVWTETSPGSGNWDEKSTPVSSVGNPFMFTGRRWDEVLALYDYRTRYYDPKLGRFLRIDTIGPWGDNNNLGNPYTYVGSNPWSYTDPFGEDIYGILEDGEIPNRRGAQIDPYTANSNSAQILNQGARAFDAGMFSAGSAAANELTFGMVGEDAVSQAAQIDPRLVAITGTLYYGGQIAGGAKGVVGGITRAGKRGLIWLGAKLGLSAVEEPGEKIILRGALTLSEEALKAVPPDVWKKGWGLRGTEIENVLGNTLGPRFPTADRISNRILYSIKSINLNDTTYQDVRKLSDKVRGYIDKLVEFTQKRYDNVVVLPEDYDSKALELAIPNVGTLQQQVALNELISYGADRGVTLYFVVVP